MYYLKTYINVLPRIQVNNYINADYNFTDWTAEGLHLVLVEEGCSEFNVNDNFKFIACPGDVIVFIPGFSYSWKSTGGLHAHTGLFVSDDLKYEILEEKDILGYKYLYDVDKTNVFENNFIIIPFHITPDSSLNIRKDFNSMLMEFGSRNICSSLVMSELFLNMVTDITRMCFRMAADVKESDFTPSYNHIYSRKIIEYLKENYKNDLDISILASLLKLNRDYMCNVFRKTTNFTLIDYLNKLRINKAKELMLSSDNKINMICKEVGIENEYYFSKLFKKYEGITPRQFKSFFSDFT
ncbi:MAG: helix-turn-helix domain-containing protein [Saccharofermentanales bacterium]